MYAFARKTFKHPTCYTLLGAEFMCIHLSNNNTIETLNVILLIYIYSSWELGRMDNMV